MFYQILMFIVFNYYECIYFSVWVLHLDQCNVAFFLFSLDVIGTLGTLARHSAKVCRSPAAKGEGCRKSVRSGSPWQPARSTGSGTQDTSKTPTYQTGQFLNPNCTAYLEPWKYWGWGQLPFRSRTRRSRSLRSTLETAQRERVQCKFSPKLHKYCFTS